MPAHSDVIRRITALAVVLSFTFGCATPRPPARPTVSVAPAPAPVLPPPTPVAPPPAAPAAPAPAPPRVSVTPGVEIPQPSESRPAAPPASVVPPSTAPPVPPAQRGKFVVLNFDNADIETVIRAVSEIVQFNYVLAPDVRGKVTVQTSGRIAQENVFNVLLAILEVNGFTAIKAGSLYKIVRIEGARERAIPTIIGNTPDPTRTDDEILTQIVPLRYAQVTELANLIRPLVSTRGALIANRETNILIITDTASNIHRLLDIVRLVDVEVALEELAIIPVRFADAAELAGILNQLFQAGRLRANLTAAPGAPPAAPAPGAPPIGPQAVRPGVPETGTTERPPLILAERRSNSLIVHARRSELDTIRRLISQLDVNIYGGRRVFIYFAENAKSKDLAATLNAIYGGRETVPATTPSQPLTGRTPGQPPPAPVPPTTTAPGPPVGGAAETGAVEGQVRFIADETTNAIITTTYPRNWPEIETTIKQLDRMPRQVLIEVLVAEITLTDATRFGIDWALRTGKFSLSGLTGAIPGATSVAAPASQVLSSAANFGAVPTGLTAFTFATDQFFTILNTLASKNLVNVLSSPHILTSENKKAVINVSNSIPIVTSQQTPIVGTATTGAGASPTVVGTQSVEYRDAGVILTVTPRIGERGTVALDVKQEVNDVGPLQPPTNSPSIIKREAETSVVLLNNQTLVLGGLIQEQRTTDSTGIPVLKDIPILGFLFGTKDRTIRKTELIILITPRVVGTALDAARVTEQKLRATPELNETIRRAPRQQQPTPMPPPRAPVPLPATPVPPPIGEPGATTPPLGATPPPEVTTPVPSTAPLPSPTLPPSPAPPAQPPPR